VLSHKNFYAEKSIVTKSCHLAEAGTHLPTPKGWKAELALAVSKSLTDMVKSGRSDVKVMEN